MADKQRKAHRRGLPVWSHFLIAILLVAVVQGFVVKVYRVPSGSMEQTLSVGQMILVNRTAGTPERGDVWVFNASEQWLGEPKPTVDGPKSALKWAAGVLGYGPGLDHALVKRVIGVPGDKVSCCDLEGRLTVNDEPLTEPYIYDDVPFVAGVEDCTTEPRSRRCFAPITVPDDRFLMLGDHRGDSSDSVSKCRREDAASDCARFATADGLVGPVIGVS